MAVRTFSIAIVQERKQKVIQRRRDGDDVNNEKVRVSNVKVSLGIEKENERPVVLGRIVHATLCTENSGYTVLYY